MKSSALYERNLFYQQLNFKYVLTKYVHSLVWKLSPSKSSRIFYLTLLFLILYLLDFMLGASLLVLILYNPSFKHAIGNTLAQYTKHILDLSKDYISWLTTGVPWGIKLNTPLNQFLGTRYLYILELWRLFYSDFICLYLSVIVDILLLMLPFGVTLSITALHDFLKFLNLCLICFFIISNRIFMLQVSALKSLGRLFMGKKWNILRERVDSYDFDMEQLLVGTLIFTILFFLLPTTGMYVLIFLYLRVIQFSVQFALRVITVFINRRTIFAVSSLQFSLQDQPMATARVLIRGMTPNEFGKRKVVQPDEVVPGKSCTLECFTIDYSDIKILWNSKEYTVEQYREILDGMSAEDLAKDLDQTLSGSIVTGASGAAASGHSMAHWLGSLPRN